MKSAQKPFSVRVCTANRAKGTAGKLLDLEGQYLSGHIPHGKKAPAAEGPAKGGESRRAVPKDPQHASNHTCNLVDAATGAQTKIHFYLILRFNGRLVTV